MALHPDFPRSPYAILSPDVRWPSEEEEHGNNIQRVPPLVKKLRQAVKEFRDNNYDKATPTSKNLLNWWFNTPHPTPTEEDSEAIFQYYFAQREALETIIYLFDVVGAQTKYDLMQFDTSGAVSTGMFPEEWRRYIVKMATGTGKTKVLSLVLAWSFFHKLYEAESSEMSRNFLIIAPNIIVLDRLYKDFNGLRIFFEDPVLPDNGFEGQNWRDDFQLTLHRQDDVRVTRPTGNIFLTNIHRVYPYNDMPDENTMEDLLRERPTGATTDPRVDLGMIVGDIDELAILNDEAHHIHNRELAWFKSIEDIHKQLSDKGKKLSFQIDTTATPKSSDGKIFVQIVADYPLVEAISQNVVKHPVLPDEVSQQRLREKSGAEYAEKYADYINLGVMEWHKANEEHQKVGKKAILFVIADDTDNCNAVADYLRTFDDFADENSVLVIHTRRDGEISEATNTQARAVLDKLREQANRIDSMDSPYKAIVSVLMLKEGWDVRNVTTIVGLRPFQAEGNILPEQILGRGLRKMYSEEENIKEYVSVIGTNRFIKFVQSIKTEGVDLERAAMDIHTGPKTPLAITVDHANKKKNINELDITIPILTPRAYREHIDLTQLDINMIPFNPIDYQKFTDEEERDINFREITTGTISHKTTLGDRIADDYRNVINSYARAVSKKLNLVGDYAILYGKIKEFVQKRLFKRPVDLESADMVKNLEEEGTRRMVIEAFEKAGNSLTVKDKGEAEIQDTIKLQEIPRFMVKNRKPIKPQKSVFNLVVGDSQLELEFAEFLEECSDVVSYAKNYSKIGFKLDYENDSGGISHYLPDFIVKQTKKKIVIVETKGLEGVDVKSKMERLKQWCADVNKAQSKVHYDFVFVDYKGFKEYPPNSFANLLKVFRKFKDD